MYFEFEFVYVLLFPNCKSVLDIFLHILDVAYCLMVINCEIIFLLRKLVKKCFFTAYTLPLQNIRSPQQNVPV